MCLNFQREVFSARRRFRPARRRSTVSGPKDSALPYGRICGVVSPDRSAAPKLLRCCDGARNADDTFAVTADQWGLRGSFSPRRLDGGRPPRPCHTWRSVYADKACSHVNAGIAVFDVAARSWGSEGSGRPTFFRGPRFLVRTLWRSVPAQTKGVINLASRLERLDNLRHPSAQSA